MSITVYDRIQRADWLHIKQTFGDTEILVTHHDLKLWFTVPRHITMTELFDKALAARGELITEYTARRAVVKALTS